MEKEISIQEWNKQFNITMKQIDTRQKIFIFTIIAGALILKVKKIRMFYFDFIFIYDKQVFNKFFIK